MTMFVFACFVVQGIVGDVSELKVEGSVRDNTARRTLVSLKFLLFQRNGCDRISTLT